MSTTIGQAVRYSGTYPVTVSVNNGIGAPDLRAEIVGVSDLFSESKRFGAHE
jgi:hypothetical protein